ncbi:hypothetical protein NliqN6_1522 [Naganishia liquefaciens]|uniref:Aminotransferase class I/classII large domain-containing protein n=1 Tax=Naganishia liquefaciens TaxID=104408 RepID=A0A8H3YD83_9TREE|nr:hypothetical protein NliqN6_1522 [Naganishia liquefaciens]
MSASLEDRLHAMLETRKGKGTFRSLKRHRIRENSDQPDTAAKIDFSSNDYLSITRSAQLKQIFLDRLAESTTPLFGSTGSRLLDGTTPHHSALEDRLSAFFSYRSTLSNSAPSNDSALLFNSGFDANVSFFSTVPQRRDYIIYDELVHASVWDGMRANERRGVPVSRRRAFRHGNVHHLTEILQDVIAKEQQALQSSSTARKDDLGMIFIAIESLYSMDGDLAPLPQIVRALEALRARYPTLINPARVCVIVDEAHTTGIYGAQGRGFVHEMVQRERERSGGDSKIAEWVQVRLMTFGKGMGSQGAVLLASPTIRSFLINYARPFIFSTAMSVANVIAIESAFDTVESDEGEELRRALFKLADALNAHVSRLIAHLAPGARHLVSTLALSESPYDRQSRDPTPIAPLLTPFPHELALYLQSCGFLVRPVVHPTVPKGEERIRICLHAGNTERDVRQMIDCVGEWASTKMKTLDRAKL